jgi:hypothetical protein
MADDLNVYEQVNSLLIRAKKRSLLPLLVLKIRLLFIGYKLKDYCRKKPMNLHDTIFYDLMYKSDWTDHGPNHSSNRSEWTNHTSCLAFCWIASSRLHKKHSSKNIYMVINSKGRAVTYFPDSFPLKRPDFLF